MNMVSLAISILWFLIGLIVILGVVWLALYVVQMFVQLPARVIQAVWAIVLILILIGALSMLAGGGGSLSHFHFGVAGPAFAAYSSSATRYLQSL
jgi:hypothetical protein